MPDDVAEQPAMLADLTGDLIDVHTLVEGALYRDAHVLAFPDMLPASKAIRTVVVRPFIGVDDVDRKAIR